MSAILPFSRAVKSTLNKISHWRVPTVEPKVVRTLPHDRTAFTQGLAYHNGLLYESCGSPSVSSLSCRNVADCSLQEHISIPNEFAEGIAIYDGLLYQLTWKSQAVRVFRLSDLQYVNEFRYQGEGWGLCRGKDGLVMSNGTGILAFRDMRFRIHHTLRVSLNRLPIRRLNDLEMVGDWIYANVFFSSEILEISATSGRVARIIDCSALKAAVNPTDAEHVLNGICYNPDEDTFFVTGKCWSQIFEVQIPSRGS